MKTGAFRKLAIAGAVGASLSIAAGVYSLVPQRLVPVQGEVLGSQLATEYKTDEDGRRIPGSQRQVMKYAYAGGFINELPSSQAQAQAQRSGVVIKSEYLEKRTNYSRTFNTNTNKLVLEAIAGVPQYYKDKEGKWWQADYATTTPEKYKTLPKSPAVKLKENPGLISWLIKNAFAVTTDFFPDPSVEVTSVDGYIERDNGENWATTHDSATGTLVDDSTAANLIARARDTGTGHIMSRAAMLYDTSAIGAGATVDSATLSLWATSKVNGDNDGNDFIALNSVTTVANTSLSTDDYNDFGTGELHDVGERKDVTSLTTGAYTTWTLNAGGLTNISLTGISKFGARDGHDILNDPVAASTNNIVIFSQAETADTTNDPKLSVTYTPAAGGGTAGVGTDIIFFE